MICYSIPPINLPDLHSCLNTVFVLLEFSVCACVYITQCVDDAHGQADTQEHECPASDPQGPGHHGVVLMLTCKHLL